MNHYYVGLATHEQESKRCDIENNITETLLSEKERKHETCVCNHLSIIQKGVVLLFAIASTIALLITFHVIPL
jgi:hypothetical protein